MKNKPSKLERVLSSIVLATALLFPVKGRAEPPKLQYSPQTVESQSQTTQDYTGILEKELDQKRKPSNELDNLDINDYQNTQSLEKTPEELQKDYQNLMKRRSTENLKVSLKELDLDWIQNLKYNFSESTDENSASSNEKPRKRFNIDVTTGVRTYLDKKNTPTGELYTDFNKPKFLGYDLKKAKISLKTKGEIGFEMQKELDSDWLGGIETQADYSGLGGNVSISKELKSKSRIKISAGEEKQKGTFLELDYRILY